VIGFEIGRVGRAPHLGQHTGCRVGRSSVRNCQSKAIRSTSSSSSSSFTLRSRSAHVSETIGFYHPGRCPCASVTT
jgi:hypothetical protein